MTSKAMWPVDPGMKAAFALFILSTLLATAGCSMEPGYAKRQGQLTYSCYTSAVSKELRVTFEGSTAQIELADSMVTLKFVPSLFPRLEDVYEGQKHQLKLDPEAFLTGPDGLLVGPCQLSDS